MEELNDKLLAGEDEDDLNSQVETMMEFYSTRHSSSEN